MAADLLPMLERWAASGAMWLTGRADGPPLGPPAPLVPALDGLGPRLARAVRAAGGDVSGVAAVDPLALLGERAAEAGYTRDGDASCGGASRLLPAADGWLVVTLARPDDDDLLPAWLGLDAVPALENRWAAVATAVGERSRDDLLRTGVELGLAVGPVDRAPVGADRPDPTTSPDGVLVTASSSDGPGRSIDGALVVDLSSLWAGPLCGSLLALAGAKVVKVESVQRPDGARRGPPGFFDLMNGGKRSVAVDLSDAGGRRSLADLVARADIVIEASRPRALAQLGIDAGAVLAGDTKVWVSITGHGRTGDAAMRVGFGDDAAAAGGLVVWDDAGPCFCADAVADPLTGVVAAVHALESLARPGAELLDVALSRVAASMAGPTLEVLPRTELQVVRPQARHPMSKAPAPGTHNGELLG